MILVDPAIWPWRGRRWAHLVSDEAYAELHGFAARLGLRRSSFQGDHYDVDEVTRLGAIGRGAQPVDCRELVRRLRDAGLRRVRSDGPWRWRTVGEWQLETLPGEGPGSWPPPWPELAPRLGAEPLAHLAQRGRAAAPGLVVRLLSRPGELAAVLSAPGPVAAPPLAEVVVEVAEGDAPAWPT